MNKVCVGAVVMIMNGSYFPSGRKGIICTAVGDIAAGNPLIPYVLCYIFLSCHSLVYFNGLFLLISIFVILSFISLLQRSTFYCNTI